MPSTKNLEHAHYVKGIDPVADAFSGTVYSDIVSMRAYEKCEFIVYGGVATGSTGTSVLTVEACDDVSASNVSAIAFWYREVVTGDTEGTLTKATTAGFTATAGSSKIAILEISQEDLAASGYGFVRLKAVESVNDPVVGCVLIRQSGPRYGKSAKATTIV
jgi:hypothetical protein